MQEDFIEIFHYGAYLYIFYDGEPHISYILMPLNRHIFLIYSEIDEVKSTNKFP